MDKYFKLFIIGSENSGRAEFLKVISDFPPISIEKKIITTERMMPLDYGRAGVEDFFFYLYSPSETVDDDLLKEMWGSFSEEMSASIILSSFNQPDYSRLQAIVSIIMAKPNIYIVVFCESFPENTVTISEIMKRADLASTTPVLSCITSEKMSIQNVLLEIARTIERFNVKTD